MDRAEAGARRAIVAGVSAVEYTDPLCPWAWGSEPTFRRLRYVLGPSVSWRQAFGLLFAEADDRPADVAAETAWYHRHLEDIATHTGAPYPAVLERVARSSRPAAVVAVAARAQGPDVAERVVRRLREHMFLLGTPPDTPGRAIAAVASVPSVDAERLVEDAASGAVAAVVARDAADTRTPVPEAYDVDDHGPHSGRPKLTDTGARYALPTVVFTGPRGRRVVPGWRPLTDYLAAVAQVGGAPPPDAPFVDADVALHRYRSLTRPDLLALTGSTKPPRRGVLLDNGSGPVWLHPDDARTHPAMHLARAGRPPRTSNDTSGDPG